MSLPQRKSPRLHGYDYSQNGTYFVTVVTHLREHLFAVTRRVNRMMQHPPNVW